MRTSAELTEDEFGVLLALVATRGDAEKVTDELLEAGLGRRFLSLPRTLTSLRNRRLIARSDDQIHHPVTDDGRRICREKTEQLADLVAYARRTLQRNSAPGRFTAEPAAPSRRGQNRPRSPPALPPLAWPRWPGPAGPVRRRPTRAPTGAAAGTARRSRRPSCARRRGG
jgi:hypothetical protein